MNTFCGYFNQGICKSCDLIDLDYHTQITRKEQDLKSVLIDLKVPKFLPSIPSPQLRFRNKAKFVITGTSQAPVIGLHGKNQLDQGREILDCQEHLEEINKALPKIKEFISLAKLEPYNIERRTGEIKGIIIFYSQKSSQMYLRFISRSKEPITRIIKHQHHLLQEIKSLEVISVNIQPIPHAILEGEEEIITTDKNFITQNVTGQEMRLGPRAFVQTNQVVAAKLYQTAAQWVKDLKISKFMELFCGQGAFSFYCAQFIEKGLGIEINPDAVIEANRTAELLKLGHLTFKAADAENVKKDLDNFSPSLILVNPPRRGLGKSLELIVSVSPEHLIYSSCSHESLAEDLRKLDSLYTIKKIQIFDMFPHTRHFETLVLLTKI